MCVRRRRRLAAGAALAAVLATAASVLEGCGSSSSSGGGGGNSTTPQTTTATTTVGPAREVKCSAEQIQRYCSKCWGHEDGQGVCQACASPMQLVDSACRCPSSPPAKPARPANALELNGKAWPEACFEGDDAHHFFVIGDWGGFCGYGKADVCAPGQDSKPFDNTYDDATHRRTRDFVVGVDDRAQHLVRDSMVKVAQTSKPEFVLNVGDNFYPGGLDDHCDAIAADQPETSATQFHQIFESMYNSTELDGKEWMGVLGNHDYGGVCYNKAWPQQIFYTWSQNTSRWIMPAQYFSRKMYFPDFSIDLYFLDSNVVDSTASEGHDICSVKGNTEPGWYCAGYLGPNHGVCEGTNYTDSPSCRSNFAALWREQVIWLEDQLNKSTADWQVVVTHFPPNWDPLRPDLMRLAAKYGIDLICTGHAHYQAIFYHMPWGGFDVGGTAWLISGGGGGITSEAAPNPHGDDNQYGFMDITISRSQLIIDAYAHGIDNRTGKPFLINTTVVSPVPKGPTRADEDDEDSLFLA